MIAIVEPIEPTPWVFNHRRLKHYDRLLEFTCDRIWRCPVERTHAHYQRHLSGNHLEVGVGTGYFLDRTFLPGPAPRLALLDISPDCLGHTAARLARYSPEVYRADALAPIHLGARGFDSIAVNYALHCMTGTFPEKGAVFANLKPLVNPGGVLFGSSVLRHGVQCDLRARAIMRLYNTANVFCNLEDSLSGLTDSLAKTFRHVEIEVIGCVAQFSARA
jgi:SAM-dependent methyltransferase